MLRASALTAAIAAIAGVVLPLQLSAGAAAAADDGSVTWSVQPADENGPDGRPWIEQTLDPGESAQEHLAVRNFSDHDVTFRLTAADGYFNENGRFNILPAGQESTAAGRWIQLPESVTVAAGETAVVALMIRVPDDAEPGDHAAGVAASISSTGADDAGATVGVESRVGFRVMTRVTGELSPSAVVDKIETAYLTAWNPVAPGRLRVEFDVVNTGNTRLRIAGVVTADGRQVDFPPQDEPQELLSGDARHFTVEIDGVWPQFVVPVAIDLEPEVIVVSGEAPTLAAMRADATAWAMPWPQLLVVLGVGMLAAALVWRRGRSRGRLDALLEEAREAGRREVAESRLP
ncbi:DUF916 domain-containing protein [Microbacterium sp. NEAU-LLC]|uniref:DUF916 domain-containing protein n=1 Tax=Microbacterium helvum TaxID=2773713 RepID=A0ABR8NID7_9MICO|nr:DUF916 domain-containing protein [Microbacterium helvum]